MMIIWVTVLITDKEFCQLVVYFEKKMARFMQNAVWSIGFSIMQVLRKFTLETDWLIIPLERIWIKIGNCPNCWP